MKYSLFALSLTLLSLMACDKECTKKAAKTDCICTYEYNPVCGCDKVTYSNPCHAACEGITDYTTGECPQ